MKNFIYETMLDDVSVCDKLIEYHKNNTEQKRRGITAGGEELNTQGKVSTDVQVQFSNNSAIQNYVEQLTRNGLHPYVEKYGLKHSHKMGLKEPFNIQHYAPNEGYFMWHCERSSSQSLQRALVWMTYLNDVDEGGETEFLYQHVRFKPKRGTFLIWPAHWTHTHRGNPPLSGDKYIVTSWIENQDI